MYYVDTDNWMVFELNNNSSESPNTSNQNQTHKSYSSLEKAYDVACNSKIVITQSYWKN
jgi:hypothetical protein